MLTRAKKLLNMAAGPGESKPSKGNLGGLQGGKASGGVKREDAKKKTAES